MPNEVYANGREVACKAGKGKVVAAFPDVCFTPPDKVPPTPPGVPVPYPVSSVASDTTKGTKKVSISGKEVMQRDSSNFKKCTGDEAGQTAKKGIVNGKLKGKVFFSSWSMDVKFEGKNAVRHLDITTSNHSSPMANESVPIPFLDGMAPPAEPGDGSGNNEICGCCGRAAHSDAQRNGDEVSEAEFYSGHPDGPAWLELARSSQCCHLVPPPPPTSDPCFKYYKNIRSTKGPRAEFSEAGANPLSNPNSLPHVYGKGQIAHKVPLSAGGCPVGERNLAPVGDDPDCKYLEKISSDIHKACMDKLK